MTRITWDAPGSRLYQAGVDRGVLYVTDGPVVPWSGLVSVTESQVNAAASPYYLDGQKVLNIDEGSDFQATIVTYALPLEFMACAGRLQMAAGLFAGDQQRQTFSFSYRTMIGNDVAGNSLAYKLHVVYNALAQLSDFSHASIGQNPSADTYSLTVTSTPLVVPGYRPAAHISLDSRFVASDILSAGEAILYGDSSHDPRLPIIPELAYAMSS